MDMTTPTKPRAKKATKRATTPKVKKATAKKATAKKAKKPTAKKATKRKAVPKAKTAKGTVAAALNEAPKGTPLVVYSKDRKGEFRWTLYAKNRTIVAAASEGFKRKASARSNFVSTLRNGSVAATVDAT